MKRVALAAAILLGGCTVNQAGQDAVDRLSTVSLADIEQAQALAALNKDDAAAQCFAAMHVVVAGIQSWPNKTVGVVTTFQMGMDITSPTGYLNINCAAERQAIKDRVQLFLGKSATLAAAFGL